MDTATLPSQFRQMWDTRPLRAREAPIAGVCTGFARRYQVDVALVRAALIGATVLGGLGLVVYIVAIFVLPKEPEHAYAPRPQRSGPPTFLLILAAVLAVTFGGGLNASWPGAGVISLALLAAGWYALHQRTPVPPPGTAVSSRFTDVPPSVGAWQPPNAQFPWQPVWQPPQGYTPQPPAQDAPSQAAPQGVQPASEADVPQDSTEPVAEQDPAEAQARAAAAPSGPMTGADSTTRTEQINPPRWDPLGAAPFAWDLPEPAAGNAPVPVAKPRSRITSVTLGAALITTAVLAALNLIGVTSISPLLIAATALAIVGAGLVVGAFRRSGHGLLVVAIPLAGAVVIGAMAQNVMSGFADAPRGDQKFTVADESALRDLYSVQAGSIKLDLRDLTLTQDRTVKARAGAGDIRIRVPESMNLNVLCGVNVGETQCPAGTVPGKNAKPGAPTLTIDAHSNVGSVEVDRG